MGEGPAALLWDVDGTLAETEANGHRRAFNQAFAEEGLPWRWDGPTYQRLLAISGGRERMAANLTTMEGQPPAPERLQRLQRRKQQHYADLIGTGQLPLRPGVERLIREAHQAGLRQGIVTTSSRSAVEALAATILGDLANAFAFWICGEDVSTKKPDPEGYLLAVQRLGLPPQRLLVLEDSAQGLAAASAAGLACLITLSAQSALEPPEHFFAARAVVDGLGTNTAASTVRRGPPCPQGMVTLSYLQCLLPQP